MISTDSPARRSARHPSGWRRRGLLAIGLCLTVVSALTVTTSQPGSAQSTFVNASVHTDPALPQPGDDVHVSVRVTGCPPGATDVQVLLAADDEGGVAGALMADAPARTSLLWRTRARVELRDAVQGWYGIRIQCGNYRPAQVPMANTTFAVGANPTATMSLAARSVTQGASVELRGTGCPGRSVDYEVLPRPSGGATFAATASVATQPDGTWSTQLTVPAETGAGPMLVRARCTVVNQLGATVYVSYGSPLDLRVELPS